MQSVFESKLNNIKELLNSVEPYEKERIEKIKARLIENLEKIKEVDYDKNRFEQELIFYIEKLDINEEKNDGRSHVGVTNIKKRLAVTVWSPHKESN